MSGGVDSSVAAARVAESGRRAFAVTLAMWPSSDAQLRDRGCCSIDAVEDARRVAARLGLPHYVWNAEAEFEDQVVAEFEDAYALGTTPNPCVRCNERVKFGVLLERALAAGATHLATGHYARVGARGARRTLHRARDRRRDQSYVLHRLRQEQLARAVFPVGGCASKAALRDEAAARGLITAAKPESQDLCFVDGSIHDELRRRLDGRFAPGPVIDGEGRQLGTHAGLPFFTVGQRSGIGVAPARPDAAPLYVLELRAADNLVVVGGREQLARSSLHATDCAWIDAAPARGTGCTAQLRAHGEPAAVTVAHAAAGELELRFAAPAVQVSPGQSVVLFAGDEVLGGGTISAAA